MNLLYAIVNYKTDAMLFEYIDSINRAATQVPELRLSIFVIDNSMRPSVEREDFIRKLELGITHSEAVFPEKNLGYFGGVPIVQAKAREIDADTVVYSNADLLLSIDFFMQLIKSECRHDSAVIAPAILSDHGNGFDQNPKHLTRLSSEKLNFLRIVYSFDVLFWLYMWLGRLKEGLRRRLKRVEGSQVFLMEGRAIYAPHGALFVFSDVNFFLSLPRHEPFLYGEELMLAEEAVRRGCTVRYVPNLRVFDLRHGSTESLKSSMKRRLMHASLIFVLKRYY